MGRAAGLPLTKTPGSSRTPGWCAARSATESSQPRGSVLSNGHAGDKLALSGILGCFRWGAAAGEWCQGTESNPNFRGKNRWKGSSHGTGRGQVPTGAETGPLAGVTSVARALASNALRCTDQLPGVVSNCTRAPDDSLPPGDG